MPTFSDIAQATGLSTQSPVLFVIRVIQIFLGFLGLIAVVLILYAGLLWMTSAGNAEKIKKAKGILRSALIGLVIILSSVGIVTYIGTFFSAATGGSGQIIDTGGGGGTGGGFGGLPVAGFNVVDTSPHDGDTGVRACQRVQGIFNDSLDAASVRSFVEVTAGGTNSKEGVFTVTSNAFSFEHTAGGVHADWTAGASNTLDIPRAVKDVKGRNLDSEKQVSFIAGAEGDTQKPEVTSTQPANNGVGVCLLPTVQIKFSEPINTASVTSGAVVLRKKGTATSLPYSLSFAALDMVTIVPSGQLDPNTQYEIAVSGIQDSCGNSMAGTFTAAFTTGDSTKLYCEPEITSISSQEGYYQQTLVTVSGSNFGVGGQVTFNGMPAGASSFDGKSNVTCWAGQDLTATQGAGGSYPAGAGSCTAGQIKVRVPVNSTTGVLQVIQGFSGSGDSNPSTIFTVKSPYITSFSPQEAAAGQYISIFGYNFGTTPGTVKFYKSDGSVVTADIAQCQNAWSDNQIVIRAPAGFAAGLSVPFEVVVGSFRSNQGKSLKALAGSPGPGICNISPTRDDKGKPYTVNGEGFGSSASGNAVDFGDAIRSNPSTWADGLIQGTSPQELTAGTYVVKVERGSAKSNGVLFTVPASGTVTPPCDAGVCNPGGGGGGEGGGSGGGGDPRCTGDVCPPGAGLSPQLLDQPSCDAVSIIQKPSPYFSKQDVCTSAIVQAEFDRAMDPSSLTVVTIVVNKILAGGARQSIAGRVSLTNNGTGVVGFQFSPNASLEAATDYEVVVRGGANGVRSTIGGTMLADKVWTFTTQQSASTACVPTAVSVTPAHATTHGAAVVFSANPSKQCVALSPAGYTFTWATPNGASVITVTAQAPSSQALVEVRSGVSGSNNSLHVVASTAGLNGSGDLDVIIAAPTIPPSVKAIVPAANATNICRNANVEISFNQKLAPDSVTASSVVFKKQATGEVLVASVSLVTLADGTSRVIVAPPHLDSSTRYVTTLTTGLTGVNGRSLSADQDYVFTTRSTDCVPVRVSIDTNPIEFTTSASQHIHGSAYTAGSIPINAGTPPQWQESWVSANPSIASVLSGDGTDNIVLLPSTNEGRTNLTYSVTVPGQPAPLSNAVNVNVSYCANPWILYAGGIYNIYIGYCRDGGLPGVIVSERTAGLKSQQIAEFLYAVDESIPASMSQADAHGRSPGGTGSINDAIGLQVWQNPKYLSPQEWYDGKVQEGVFGRGSPQSFQVGQWSAIRDGNTVFISAPGGVMPGGVYPDIFVLTYNQGARAATQDIVAQLLAGMRFLTNSGLSENDEKALNGDMTRLADISRLRRALKTYFDKKGAYPTIPAGSFKVNESTSRWPVSWQGFGTQLGITMPLDPLNTFGAQCSQVFGAGYDDETCYNKTLGNSSNAFQCPSLSHIYDYTVNNAGNAYSISANMEYSHTSGLYSWLGQPIYQIGRIGDCRSFMLTANSPL